MATGPGEHVALYLSTPPTFPDTDFFGVEMGLIDVQQFYIRVQPSFSSWLLQSCHTAGSIRANPPLPPPSPCILITVCETENTFSNHTPCLKLQAPNNSHKYCIHLELYEIMKIHSRNIFIPYKIFYSGSLSNPTSFYFVHFDPQ